MAQQHHSDDKPRSSVSKPELVVSPSAEALAADVVARLVPALGLAIEARGRALLALTGGSVMEAVWAALVEHPSAKHHVDWSKVKVFWGDERFVPHDSPDRNDLSARRILLDKPPFSSAALHPMPASDGPWGDDLDAAAAEYAALLEAEDAVFDVVLLGIGPDGHCCSLFPDHPSALDLSATVVPVRDSPKPPPLRISLSFDGLNAARQIWVVASGAGKADAVTAALAEGANRVKVPTSGARGTEQTLWLLDQAAASKALIRKLP